MDAILNHPIWSHLITTCPKTERICGYQTPDDVIVTETDDRTELTDGFGVIRWSGYVKNRQVARVQNTGQHMISTNVVIQPTITEPFIQAGKSPDEAILKSAIDQHDIPEIECYDRGLTTDSSYQTRRNEDELNEYEKFSKIHASAPKPVFDKLYKAYLLQHAAKEMMFLPAKAKEILKNQVSRYSLEISLFEMIERVGYLVYAFEQLKHGHIQIAVDTLNFQGPHLDSLADRYPIFSDLLWGPKISQAGIQYVEDMADEYPNYTRTSRKVWLTNQCPNKQ